MVGKCETCKCFVVFKLSKGFKVSDHTCPSKHHPLKRANWEEVKAAPADWKHYQYIWEREGGVIVRELHRRVN